MIIFATNHDDSTAESSKIAKSIIESEDIIVLENTALKPILILTLQENPQEQLMLFSHGDSSTCFGNDELPALTVDNIKLLTDRKVFAYACWTAIELGKEASVKENCIYAGYNDVVITGGSDIPNEMQKIFQFIKNHFHTFGNEYEIQKFLDVLRQLCTEIEQHYLARYPEKLDYISISAALRSIWAKLQIWCRTKHYTHPDAPEPLLW